MFKQLISKKMLLSSVLLVSLILFLTSCAVQTTAPVPPEEIPGFFSGLLHGFIALFSFIASFFTDCAIYAYPNAGGWYDFGFLLGVAMFFGGGGAGTKKNKW